jgi:hypothetical protein
MNSIPKCDREQSGTSLLLYLKIMLSWELTFLESLNQSCIYPSLSLRANYIQSSLQVILTFFSMLNTFFCYTVFYFPHWAEFQELGREFIPLPGSHIYNTSFIVPRAILTLSIGSRLPSILRLVMSAHACDANLNFLKSYSFSAGRSWARNNICSIFTIYTCLLVDIGAF